MPYYLSKYVGSGTKADPFRPIGSDQSGWSAIDLRPDGGASLDGGGLNACLLHLPVAINARGLTKISEEKLEQIGPAIRNAIKSSLNVSFSSTRFDEIVAELMLNPPINGWKPLRVWRDGEMRIDLNGLLWSQRLAGGGASYSESWGCADSASLTCNLTWTEILGTAWELSGNRARCGGFTNAVARADHDLATDDHEVSATLQTYTYGSGILIAAVFARKDSTTTRDYYAFEARQSAAGIANSFHVLTKIIGGADTQLGATDNTDVAIGQIMMVRCNGSEITGLRNGSISVGPVTDTAIVDKYRGGVQYYGENASSQIEFDDWLAADLAAGGGEEPPVVVDEGQPFHRRFWGIPGHVGYSIGGHIN